MRANLSTAVLATLTSLLFVACGEGDVVEADADALARRGNGGGAGMGAIDPEAVSDEAIEDLLFMREEEKLARDVYRSLYREHGLLVHSNIARSEDSHMAAIGVLVDALDLEDPVVDPSLGAFTNPDLAQLYDDLVAEGTPTSTAALFVGATIEDLDMVDIVDAMTRTDEPALLNTYDNLLCGSRNHLRSFVGQLEARGETYEATFMDPVEMEAILAGSQERCGR